MRTPSSPARTSSHQPKYGKIKHQQDRGLESGTIARSSSLQHKISSFNTRLAVSTQDTKASTQDLKLQHKTLQPQHKTVNSDPRLCVSGSQLKGPSTRAGCGGCAAPRAPAATRAAVTAACASPEYSGHSSGAGTSHWSRVTCHVCHKDTCHGRGRKVAGSDSHNYKSYSHCPSLCCDGQVTNGQ